MKYQSCHKQAGILKTGGMKTNKSNINQYEHIVRSSLNKATLNTGQVPVMHHLMVSFKHKPNKISIFLLLQYTKVSTEIHASWAINDLRFCVRAAHTDEKTDGR